ncbi:MAG TPA: DUF1932 domain-containing protein [Beijerinckiaceae bacterium]|nr:DUF1932 domain-containing protein [Beijerinckiaceae bacterium]
MARENRTKIALIGFGEVGRTFARDLVASGAAELATFDILLREEKAGSAMRARAGELGVRVCERPSDAAREAAIVFSAVTAVSAYEAAEEAATYLRPGQYFVDLNSVSPQTKRRDAAALESCGAFYVEAAVMAPVAPYGIKVPIVLGGAHAARAKTLLAPLGMRLTIGDAEIGKASALKMCRSIMIKGIEALTVECLTASRIYGVEDEVLASLAQTYPGVDWEKTAGYNLERTISHGRRRAAEMREVADTVAETGLAPSMSQACATRIDWVAEQVESKPGLREIADEDWRERLDVMARAAGLRRPTK